MPLVRYRTGDRTRILPGSYPCGSSLRRIGPVQRLDATEIRSGGEKIDANELDETLLSIPQIVDYRIGRSADARNNEKLRFLIETVRGTKLNLCFVRHTIEERLKARPPDY